MTDGEKRTPCAEEIDAYGCFGKADRKLAAGNFNSAMGLFRMGVRKLETVAGQNAKALVRFDIAETIASIGSILVGQGTRVSGQGTRVRVQILTKRVQSEQRKF